MSLLCFVQYGSEVLVGGPGLGCGGRGGEEGATAGLTHGQAGRVQQAEDGAGQGAGGQWDGGGQQERAQLPRPVQLGDRYTAVYPGVVARERISLHPELLHPAPAVHRVSKRESKRLNYELTNALHSLTDLQSTAGG